MQNTQNPIVVLGRIKENIEKSLISSETKVLLAISGGVDSVVLCDALLKLGIPFDLAHCNFSLRGEASDLDQKKVEEIASKFEVYLHVIRFDTAKVAQEKGMSIQLIARELRYDWFRRLKATFSYEAILTGHHLNDRVETALINFTRGTGISGLRSIQLKNMDIIRPLSTITKEAVYAYAKINQLSWREDKSNTNTKYARNLIRNEVVPLLAKLNPSFIEGSVNTFSRLLDTELIYKEALQEKISIVKSNDSIDIVLLRSMVGARQVLYEILSQYKFSYSQAMQVFDALNTISGKVFMSESHRLILDRDMMYIEEVQTIILDKHTFDWKATKNVCGNNVDYTFSQIVTPQSLHTTDDFVNISLDRLSDQLVIRKWQIGDKIRPFGMKGKQKKVSDILIDKKVPVNKKENVMVLESKGEIVWLIGYCFSNTFAVKEFETKVCQVKRINK